MRSFFSIIALLVVTVTGSTVFAAPQPIPTERLKDYKMAVLIAIRQSKIECIVTKGSPSASVVSRLDRAQSGTVNLEGTQPLLELTSEEAGERSVVTVTTSSDFKTIVSLKVEDFHKDKVNVGDLLNPSIADGYQCVAAFSCQMPQY